jgi:hypothetical protein
MEVARAVLVVINPPGPGGCRRKPWSKGRFADQSSGFPLDSCSLFVLNAPAGGPPMSDKDPSFKVVHMNSADEGPTRVRLLLGRAGHKTARRLYPRERNRVSVRDINPGSGVTSRAGPGKEVSRREERNMSMDEFRRRADECRRLAAAARNTSDKAFWLGLVERWHALESQSVLQPGRAKSRSPLRRQPEAARD